MHTNKHIYAYNKFSGPSLMGTSVVQTLVAPDHGLKP